MGLETLVFGIMFTTELRKAADEVDGADRKLSFGASFHEDEQKALLRKYVEQYVETQDDNLVQQCLTEMLAQVSDEEMETTHQYDDALDAAIPEEYYWSVRLGVFANPEQSEQSNKLFLLGRQVWLNTIDWVARDEAVKTAVNGFIALIPDPAPTKQSLSREEVREYYMTALAKIFDDEQQAAIVATEGEVEAACNVVTKAGVEKWLAAKTVAEEKAVVEAVRDECLRIIQNADATPA